MRTSPVLSLVACLFVAGGCSSSDDGSTGDSTSDSSSTGSTGSTGSGGASPQCGADPTYHLHAGLVSYTTFAPVVGARATLDACPEQTFVSDESGNFDIDIAANQGFDPRIEADGFITTRSGQSSLQADLDAGASPFFPTSVESFFPDLTPTSPAVLVLSALGPGVQPDPNDPCTDRSGITYAVVDHPEAIVTYYSGTSMQPVLDPTLTSTTHLGSAEIGGLAETPGPDVELVAEKPGCEISFVSYPHLGKYRLENGVLTMAGAFMPPIPPP